ncbi:flagellar basal body L-ring protein FlgH [Salipiger sp. PrR002]|uniref:flagellar basal body L-ring protein FlgH n=1 Tax=Salipiger sp. PrR002 TaxID=2706489 RepID=UPI0013BD7BDA|nr:flagellar basal body L-ring protein FlgH [Salipiger sp. PrR002]NDW00963.1 flagellar basal body L-ring protein FlgH [Salipiger sp. PrR002]NDW56510.1 flagellar basal body L-ring protein FlgH [Salipiger sp. PrR004]
MTPLRHGLMAVSALGLLAGCGSPAFDRDPEVSRVGLDPQTLAEARSVNIPMPPPKPDRIPYRAEGASLWERGSSGFFGDQRATQIGDILTILVEIEDEASLSNESDRTRTGGSTLGFPSFFGYGTQIDKILPGVGPEDLPSGDNIVDITSTTGASGSGSIDREETINLRMAALVVQELPNGNFVVAGRQEVKVNEELRELRVTGIIRPQDIDRTNAIPYDKIAEARISYGGRGSVSRQQTRGYGEDVMDVILPY